MEYTEGERISRLTLDVLLTWMGQPPINDPDNGILPFKHEGVYVAGFTPPPLIPDPIPTEESCTYLPMSSLTSLAQTDLLLTVDAIPQRQSSVSITLTSLGKRYSDPTQVDYRVAVVSSLKSIILHNVFALSYNPIFGQLWRAVCKENSIEKEELTNLFSQQIGQIKDDEKKKNMRAFVENSYDATEQIQEMINKAPAGGKRMYLDLDAMGQGGVDLTRMELLEVSRSCHSGVMAKLATIFTHAKVCRLISIPLFVLTFTYCRSPALTSYSARANDSSLSTFLLTKSSNLCLISSSPVPCFLPDLHTSWLSFHS